MQTPKKGQYILYNYLFWPVLASFFMDAYNLILEASSPRNVQTRLD